MSIVEFLSQPLWQRLGLTLVHFLWQGLAVAVLAGVLVRVFRLKHGNARYGAYLLAFIAMIVCPVVTFTAIDISISPNTELVTGVESTEVVGSSPYTALPAGDILPEAETSSPAMPTVANSIPLGQRISGWLNVSMPWMLVIWMVGVIVLSVRLLMGFVGVYRWRHHLEPLPERLAQRIASLSEGLGMRGFSRVFISPTVLQAMAVGYLRPMVLLPAVMVTQMQPEMLEAVIAHELAHIRRFDLWINLAQRVTETLLFYHPAVWWLSICLRSERELCCDELAVKATGERLTYASALEYAARARLFGRQPALAVGLGQSRPMLSRVRHILGGASTQQNSRFWIAGVITVLLLAALAIPTTVALTSWSSEGSHEIKSSLLRELADPKVDAEGQRILKRMAEVNRYWLVAPPSEVRDYSYNFNFHESGIKEPEPEIIRVSNPRKTRPSFRQGITYCSILHKLATDPSAAIIHEIQESERTIRVDFVLKESIKITCGNGVHHSWRGYFTTPAKAGSLWLDTERMVPVKAKTGPVEEYFSEYVAIDDIHYVPLRTKIDQGAMHFDWIFGLYEPGLWLFDSGYYPTGMERLRRLVASINNVQVNTGSAMKMEAPRIEVASVRKVSEAQISEGDKRARFFTLVLGKDQMEFEGKAVTWDTLASVLAKLPDRWNAGLQLVVAFDELSLKELMEAKTRVSLLAKELGFSYFNGISEHPVGPNASPTEYFFAAPIEFNKGITIGLGVSAEFKQKNYYREADKWIRITDDTEKHKEWTTVGANSIHFRRRWFRDVVDAKLKVRYGSWPKAKWQLTVRLLDEKGKSLAQASSELDTGGSIFSGRVLTMWSDLEFSLGQKRDVSKATSFEITIVPLLENDSGPKPSATTPEETPDGAEVELKRFLEKHPKAQKVPYDNKPAVQIEVEKPAVQVEGEVAIDEIDAETLINKVRQSIQPSETMQISWSTETMSLPPTKSTWVVASNENMEDKYVLWQNDYNYIISGVRSRFEYITEVYQNRDDKVPFYSRRLTSVFDSKELHEITEEIKNGNPTYVGRRSYLDDNRRFLFQRVAGFPPDLNRFNQGRIFTKFEFNVFDSGNPGIYVLDAVRKEDGMHWQLSIDGNRNFNNVKTVLFKSDDTGGISRENNVILKRYDNGFWYPMQVERIQYHYDTGEVQRKSTVDINVQFHIRVQDDIFKLDFPQGMRVFDVFKGKWVTIDGNDISEQTPAGQVEKEKRALQAAGQKN